MIYYVSTERFSTTVRRLLKAAPDLRATISPFSYEELFFERGGPIGHYIFTDFDRSSRYELECAAAFAAALRKAAPQARILNDPLRTLERFPLLVALHKAGINDFTAVRLEGGGKPQRYPVFIRAEDGYGGPETDVLHDEAAFDAAVADLSRRGLPLRGRIAIGFAAERNADGFFRKYAAYCIGGTIVANHVMRGTTWAVKNNVAETAWIKKRDETHRLSEAAVAEEYAYVRDNPHAEILARAFAVAGTDFGRADYGLVGGRVQIYEINTNPSLNWSQRIDARMKQMKVLRHRITAAFTAIDTSLPPGGRIRFTEARPRAHNLHWPRRRLAKSLFRRAVHAIGKQ